MAVIRRLEPTPEADHAGLGQQLARLIALHTELALAELRGILRAAAIALAVAAAAAVMGLASVIVLLAGALAPLFDARWPHLITAGGAALLLSLAALGWGVWRVRRLELPRDTVRSLMENWEWLVRQVRSRLTLR